MPLDQQDSAQLNYKADIKYYQKRIAALNEGLINPVVAATTPVDPDVYISNLNDLSAKAKNLLARIDHESSGLKIPVSQTTDPVVYSAVLAIDPASGGNYISYETYSKCLDQINAGIEALNVEKLVASASNDPSSNSQLIQATIYSGYASYSGSPTPSSNTYEDTIQTWGGADSSIQQVVNFSNNYLNTFPDPSYLPWAFKADVTSEVSQIGSMTGLWNSFSSSGRNNLQQLGGSLQALPPIAVDPNILAATNSYLDYANNALNNINNLLNSTWSTELMCCLLNLSVVLDLRTLLALITLLQMLKFNVSFDFKELLSSFENVLTNMMRNLILNELLNIIMQVYNRVVKPIENWINTEERILNNLAAQCPSIQQLIQTYIIGSTRMAENQFNGMIVELMKSIELKKIQSSAKLSLASMCNWINQATQAFGMVKEAMELAAQSASDLKNLPSSVANQVVSQLPGKSTYQYPISDNPSMYNTFPETPPQPSVMPGFQMCGQTIPQSNIPPAPNWNSENAL